MIDPIVILSALDMILGSFGFMALAVSPALHLEDQITRVIIFLISASLFISGVVLWMS